MGLVNYFLINDYTAEQNKHLSVKFSIVLCGIMALLFCRWKLNWFLPKVWLLCMDYWKLICMLLCIDLQGCFCYLGNILKKNYCFWLVYLAGVVTMIEDVLLLVIHVPLNILDLHPLAMEGLDLAVVIITHLLREDNTQGMIVHCSSYTCMGTGITW